MIEVEQCAASLKNENQTMEVQMNQMLDQQLKAESDLAAKTEQFTRVQQQRDEFKVRACL